MVLLIGDLKIIIKFLLSLMVKYLLRIQREFKKSTTVAIMNRRKNLLMHIEYIEKH